MMTTIEQNIHTVLEQIQKAAIAAGRDPSAVRLIAVSKQQPLRAVEQAIAAGQRDFGENYLQEALPKIKQLGDKNLNWHFIGAIQANKTQAIAENFSWVHSVDRLKIAQRLSQQRPLRLAPLNICIQVNIHQESSKAGLSLTDLPALVAQVYPLTHLKLRGFMAIPNPQLSLDQIQTAFEHLKQTLDELKEKYPSLDTLSMGMSQDFVPAIAAGASWVRIGRAIFGERKK